VPLDLAAHRNGRFAQPPDKRRHLMVGELVGFLQQAVGVAGVAVVQIDVAQFGQDMGSQRAIRPLAGIGQRLLEGLLCRLALAFRLQEMGAIVEHSRQQDGVVLLAGDRQRPIERFPRRRPLPALGVQRPEMAQSRRFGHTIAGSARLLHHALKRAQRLFVLPLLALPGATQQDTLPALQIGHRRRCNLIQPQKRIHKSPKPHACPLAPAATQLESQL